MTGADLAQADRYRTDLLAAWCRSQLPGFDLDEPGWVERAAAEGAPLRAFKRTAGLARVDRVIGTLRGLAPRSLLDIGPGRGVALWTMVEAFPELDITAVDVLAHRVAVIEAVRAGGLDRLRAIVGDAARLPYDEGQFDLVTILEVLEHVEDPGPVASEAVRVADRFVVASVPSVPDDNPEHLRLFTPLTLTEVFEQAGATSVSIDHVLNHMVAVVQV